MKFSNHTAPPAGFQLAPMIDIVFLLLAFFIVTYQLTDQEKDLEVNLPTAEEGRAKVRTYTEKVINIHEDGKIVIDLKPYSLDELESKMGNLVTDYEHIVRVIDRCRKAGVWNISFATGVPKRNN